MERARTPRLLFTALKVKVHPEKHRWENRGAEGRCSERPLSFYHGPPAVSSQHSCSQQPSHPLQIFSQIMPEPHLGPAEPLNTLHSLTLRHFPDLSSMAFPQSPLQPCSCPLLPSFQTHPVVWGHLLLQPTWSMAPRILIFAEIAPSQGSLPRPPCLKMQPALHSSSLPPFYFSPTNILYTLLILK